MMVKYLSKLILLLPFLVFGQNQNFTVQFNKNLEYLGYLIELGDPGDNDKNSKIYQKIHQFPENKKLDGLNRLFELAGDMDYGSLVYLMYHLPDFPLKNNFELEIDLISNLGFDDSDKSSRLKDLVNELNRFYLESNFHKIWDDLETERQDIRPTLRNKLFNNEIFTYLEDFYNQKFEHYILNPVINLWPSGFALGNPKSGQAVFIMGPLENNYNFKSTDIFLNLAIHEFGHSFANPIVLQHNEIMRETERLFQPIEADMKNQGYTNWKTCLIEHFVRAGEVIIREKMGNLKESEALKKTYLEDKKFIFLPFIIQQIKHYKDIEGFDYNHAVERTLIDLKSNY